MCTGVESIDLLSSKDYPGQNRGFAFVEFYNHACAQLARNVLSAPTYTCGQSSSCLLPSLLAALASALACLLGPQCCPETLGCNGARVLLRDLDMFDIVQDGRPHAERGICRAQRE